MKEQLRLYRVYNDNLISAAVRRHETANWYVITEKVQGFYLGESYRVDAEFSLNPIEVLLPAIKRHFISMNEHLQRLGDIRQSLARLQKQLEKYERTK